MEPLEIKQKKLAFITIALGSSIVFSGIFNIFINRFGAFQGDSIDLLILITYVVLILMVLAVGIRALLNLFNAKPAMVIHAQGITDNISLAEAGLIPWENIQGSKIHREGSRTYLVILLKNYTHILLHVNSWRTDAVQAQVRNTGSPININKSYLDANLDTLNSLINERVSV